MGKENEKEHFGVLMAALFESFGKPLSDAQLLGYKIGLSGISPQGVENAVSRALRECEYLPPPATLRRLAGELGVEDRSLIAWSELLTGIRGARYQSRTWQDPVINAVIRACWGNLVCLLDLFAKGQSEEKWIRIDFLKFYRALYGRRLGADEVAPFLNDRRDEPEVIPLRHVGQELIEHD